MNDPLPYHFEKYVYERGLFLKRQEAYKGYGNACYSEACKHALQIFKNEHEDLSIAEIHEREKSATIQSFLPPTTTTTKKTSESFGNYMSDANKLFRTRTKMKPLSDEAFRAYLKDCDAIFGIVREDAATKLTPAEAATESGGPYTTLPHTEAVQTAIINVQSAPTTSPHTAHVCKTMIANERNDLQTPYNSQLSEPATARVRIGVPALTLDILRAQPTTNVNSKEIDDDERKDSGVMPLALDYALNPHNNRSHSDDVSASATSSPLSSVPEDIQTPPGLAHMALSSEAGPQSAVSTSESAPWTDVPPSTTVSPKMGTKRMMSGPDRRNTPLEMSKEDTVPRTVSKSKGTRKMRAK